MANGGARYYGGYIASDWKLVGSVITMIAILVTALWTVVTNENVNNRQIVDELHSNYTTKQAHNDLERRLDGAIAEEDRSHAQSLSKAEFNAWRIERDKLIDRIQTDIANSSTKLEQIIRDRASVDSLISLQRQIDAMEKRIDRISEREDRRHIRIPTEPTDK
jgi:biopolymer transport protein ExbB/TolQ